MHVHSVAIPNQYGGTFPEIRIVDGIEGPRLVFEPREGKPDQRIILVGNEYLIAKVISELDALCEIRRER